VPPTTTSSSGTVSGTIGVIVVIGVIGCMGCMGCMGAMVQRHKLNLKLQTLKPGFHLIGARVETRRFQAAMGQLDSTCTAPPWESSCRGRRRASQAVAVQVEFEKANFETSFSLNRRKG
jgi:hypothetical protein